MTRGSIRIATVLAVMALAVLLNLNRVNALQQTAPVSFTAVITETNFNDNQQVHHQETHILAVRADGSQVLVLQRIFPDGKTYDLRTIKDVSLRKEIHVSPPTNSVTTY